MYRSLRYAGVGLIVIGALLTVAPTASFTTFAGDRSVDVAFANDGDAFVALQGRDVTVDTTEEGVVVAELVNNLQSSMTLSYETSVDGPLNVTQPSDTVTIGRGQTQPLNMTCSSGGTSGETTLTVQIIEARAGGTTITDASLETTIQYDCPDESGERPTDPELPDSAVAWIDDNNNVVYEEGEELVGRDELRTFDRDNKHLVIAADGERIDYRNRQVQIKAQTVRVLDSTLSSNKKVEITGEGGIVTIRDATVESKNGQIKIQGAALTARQSTITTNKKIELTAESDAVTLTDTTIDSKNGEIAVKGGSIIAPRATFTTNKKIKLTAESGPLTVPDATLESKNGEIELKGRTIEASGADISTNKAIKLTAYGGDVLLADASVTSKNDKITVKSNGHRVLANRAVFETNKQIVLTSSGDMRLNNARIRSSNGEATLTLNLGSATLAVDGATLDDRDDIVRYSPSGVTVSGTPEQGQLRAG